MIIPILDSLAWTWLEELEAEWRILEEMTLRLGHTSIRPLDR